MHCSPVPSDFPKKPPFDPKWYSYYIYPEFEFDSSKSASNLVKHGIDFIEAQKLWTDENRRVIPGSSDKEPREGIIARIGPDFWTCIYTCREGKVRIISARRSRDEEKKFYRQGAQDFDGR